MRQEVRGRDLSDEVVAVLEGVGVELCVIGVRRRSAVGKMTLGSNVFRVLMDAPCPELSVKPEAD